MLHVSGEPNEKGVGVNSTDSEPQRFRIGRYRATPVCGWLVVNLCTRVRVLTDWVLGDMMVSEGHSGASCEW